MTFDIDSQLKTKNPPNYIIALGMCKKGLKLFFLTGGAQRTFWTSRGSTFSERKPVISFHNYLSTI